MGEGEGEEAQPIFLNVGLTKHQGKHSWTSEEGLKMFAWICAHMPGLDPQMVMCKLIVREGTRSVKQASRNFQSDLEVHIKQEIQKLLDVGFIRPIHHPICLTNVVLVKKKNR